VQSSVIQILPRRGSLPSRAVVLSPSSGLVGRPVVAADGKVTARAFIQPDLYPGRTVQFRTADLSGTYRIEKAKYTGDTFGTDWYVDLECEELLVQT
jgi:hypothetical protein